MRRGYLKTKYGEKVHVVDLDGPYGPICGRLRRNGNWIRVRGNPMLKDVCLVCLEVFEAWDRRANGKHGIQGRPV